jgi:exodeoxyribonuclease VII large subunit
MPQIPFLFQDRAPDRPPDRPDKPDPPKQPERPVIYTVGELQGKLRAELEERYPNVLVTGEISNFSINARSGHAYFTLKDDDAQVKCVMWRDSLMRVRHRLDDGLKVIVRAKVTIYEQGGQLQLSVLQIEPKGLGARQLEYRERVEKLRAEGLCADARKRPIPKHPKTIGLVTSKGSAAIKDVLRAILRRDPFAHVIIANTPVQGDEASHSIVRALKAIDNLGRCDVILLVRGGGSIEDLWCFNEENVARAIAGTRAPVVTGIGHETDTTIADLVADLRASTPTAAAEHAVPVRSEVRVRFHQVESALHRSMVHRLESLSKRMLKLSSRLYARDPAASIKRRAQRFDELTSRSERSIRAQMQRKRDLLLRLERRLQRHDPREHVRSTAHRLKMLEARAKTAIAKSAAEDRHALSVVVHRLESLSPLKVLSRGYALVRAKEGRVVKRASDVDVGERLSIRLAEGEVEASVTEIRPDSESSA